MSERVLVTGGAGFIGRRLAQRLLTAGYEVRILDALLAHVHGADPSLPGWLRTECDLRIADIRDRNAVDDAAADIDAVIHLAADTGTAESLYKIERYVDVNVGGTGILLESLLPRVDRLRKVVIASSRAVYGEGKYDCPRCHFVYPAGRSGTALAAGQWDPVCPRCGGPIETVPTDEASETHPTSIYGATKLAQEQLATTFGQAFGVSVVALRYQNVYGSGQSLVNPYAGILTHFFGAAVRGQAPHVFEDGLPSRDFVHVDDAAEVTARMLESTMQGVVNVGSGVRTTLMEIATAMCDAVAPDLRPVVSLQYRIGDIRHACADIGRAAAGVGFLPRVELKAGLLDFTGWALTEPKRDLDLFVANAELASQRLLRSAVR